MSEAVTQVASGRSRTRESEKWLQNDERDGVWLTDVRMGPQPAKDNKNAGREKQGGPNCVRGGLADEAQESGTYRRFTFPVQPHNHRLPLPPPFQCCRGECWQRRPLNIETGAGG